MLKSVFLLLMGGGKATAQQLSQEISVRGDIGAEMHATADVFAIQIVAGAGVDGWWHVREREGGRSVRLGDSSGGKDFL